MSPGRRAAFGTWPSPLSAGLMAAGGVRLSGMAQRGDEVWWSELRPVEAGRCVLVRRLGSGDAVDMLAAPWSARTQVHEYGGGAWWLGATSAYFASWSDQRLYRLDPAAGEAPAAGVTAGEAPAAGVTAGEAPAAGVTAGGAPVALTPEPPSLRGWRFADGREHPGGRWMVCVRERHGDGPEAVNELVAVSVDGSHDVQVLDSSADLVAAGGPVADFVAAPRFSADGRWLCWIRWSHPLMPWDGTQLCVAPVLDGPGGVRLGDVEVVAGGDTEAVHGGDWTADGRLVFSTDRTGFWNLNAWDPRTATDRALTDLSGAEIGAPPWVFGTRRWAELPAGRLVAAVTRSAIDELVVIEADGTITPLDTPYVGIAELGATDRDTILVHGATATTLPALVELDLSGNPVAAHRPPDDLGFGEGWFSTGRPVTYRCGEREAHAFVYEPAAPDLDGEPGELPPLVVMGHGGPTSHASPALNLRVQYWTSRGFAVADVNYGGSSGFGRAYRRLLDGAWGVVDVEDCIAIASHLAAGGVVDPARLAIRGGSAGGFTVLSALARSDVFAAGTSLYGVADLEALARDTHKFESRYLDGLIGPYPERRDLYQARSPINHTAELSCPLLVLQGLEDEVVPPNQSEAIVAALAAKGIPHAYVAFEGEQHGFRQGANIARSYEVELWFYGRVFGFTPADPIEPPGGAAGL